MKRNHVCPVELSATLDNNIRRWLHNPHKLLAPYVREGMTVLDLGCGPGFFSIPLAMKVGGNGRVIAADVQEGMLQRLENKIKGTVLEERITLVQCEESGINMSDEVDFILMFYMVHEVRDRYAFFGQVNSVLKDDGLCLLIEPKLFHVSRKEFQNTIRMAEMNGFETQVGPQLLWSWSRILKKRMQ